VGIFIEELRQELGRRGIVPGLGGETHALPDHDETTQRTQLESLLNGGGREARRGREEQ